MRVPLPTVALDAATVMHHWAAAMGERIAQTLGIDARPVVSRASVFEDDLGAKL